MPGYMPSMVVYAFSKLIDKYRFYPQVFKYQLRHKCVSYSLKCLFVDDVIPPQWLLYGYTGSYWSVACLRIFIDDVHRCTLTIYNFYSFEGNPVLI